MRYSAFEKLEIIRLVEQSHQPVKRTLEQIGVSRPTFYRWYDLYRRFGQAELEDRRGGSGQVSQSSCCEVEAGLSIRERVHDFGPPSDFLHQPYSGADERSFEVRDEPRLQ